MADPVETNSAEGKVENDYLLDFPLAAFFRPEFIKAAFKKKRKDVDRLPETSLMCMVGCMCAEEKFVSARRQPTVRDLVALTSTEVQAYPNIGYERGRFIVSYLALFGLKLAIPSDAKFDLSEVEDKLLKAI